MRKEKHEMRARAIKAMIFNGVKTSEICTHPSVNMKFNGVRELWKEVRRGLIAQGDLDEDNSSGAQLRGNAICLKMFCLRLLGYGTFDKCAQFLKLSTPTVIKASQSTPKEQWGAEIVISLPEGKVLLEKDMDGRFICGGKYSALPIMNDSGDGWLLELIPYPTSDKSRYYSYVDFRQLINLKGKCEFLDPYPAFTETNYNG